MNQLSLNLEAGLPFKYVMDTSALIDIGQMYNQQVFKTPWRKLAEAAQKKEIIFVEATWEELNRRSVFLADWVNPFYLHQPTPDEQEFVGLLQEHYPDLVDWNATREFADPYILACAKHFGLSIISQEKPNLVKSKIPPVAEDLGIPCLNLSGFFLEAGWEF
jgi:hypothetical protein